MKKEDIEKYIANLSPELQEKARACKNMGELKKLIAENDIELPEDVLEAVSGGANCGGNVGFTADANDNCEISVNFNTNFKKPNLN